MGELEERKREKMAVKLADSNIAGIGSDLDKQLREQAAGSEEAFDGAGQENGIEVWRIEKFEPVRLPPSEFGVFYSGDSFIVLKTVKNDDGEKYDLYYWLGKDSTQVRTDAFRNKSSLL